LRARAPQKEPPLSQLLLFFCLRGGFFFRSSLFSLQHQSRHRVVQKKIAQKFLIHQRIQSIFAISIIVQIKALIYFSFKKMGSIISRIPETLTEEECKKLAGIRWQLGVGEAFASAVKNEDGTINKSDYMQYFQIDPFQVLQNFAIRRF
jgi:hypothetical protein